MSHCPICNNELTQADNFCPNCGYEIHIIPHDISDAASEYEKTREAKYIQLWNTAKNAQESIVNLKKQIEKANADLKSIVNEKNKLESDLLIERARLIEESVQAFMVVGIYEETLDGKLQHAVKDIIPIYLGENIIGKMPQKRTNIHTKSVILDTEMQKEHFCIENNDDNKFIIKNLSGRTYIKNKHNQLTQPIELYSGEEVFIGNLIFTFISAK